MQIVVLFAHGRPGTARQERLPLKLDINENFPDPGFLTHGPKTRREFLNLLRWSGGPAA